MAAAQSQADAQIPPEVLQIEREANTYREDVQNFCIPIFKAAHDHLVLVIVPNIGHAGAIGHGLRAWMNTLQKNGTAPSNRYGLMYFKHDNFQVAYCQGRDALESGTPHERKLFAQVLDIARPGKHDEDTVDCFLRYWIRGDEIRQLGAAPSNQEYLRMRTVLDDFRATARRLSKQDLQCFSDAHWSTVRNASFIVGTAADLGSELFLKHVLDRATFIIVGYAQHQRRDHLIPFFAAPFTNMDDIIAAFPGEDRRSFRRRTAGQDTSSQDGLTIVNQQVRYTSLIQFLSIMRAGVLNERRGLVAAHHELGTIRSPVRLEELSIGSGEFFYGQFTVSKSEVAQFNVGTLIRTMFRYDDGVTIETWHAHCLDVDKDKGDVAVYTACPFITDAAGVSRPVPRPTWPFSGREQGAQVYMEVDLDTSIQDNTMSYLRRMSGSVGKTDWNRRMDIAVLNNAELDATSPA